MNNNFTRNEKNSTFMWDVPPKSISRLPNNIKIAQARVEVRRGMNSIFWNFTLMEVTDFLYNLWHTLISFILPTVVYSVFFLTIQKFIRSFPYPPRQGVPMNDSKGL